MSFPTLSRRNVWALTTNERGKPLVALSWTFDALDALDDSNINEILLWAKRQIGKSTFNAVAGSSEMLCVPNSYVIYVCSAAHQVEAVYSRKLVKPLKLLARELGIENDIKFTANRIEIPSRGSVIELVSTNDATVPGRSPTLVIFDEARDIPDSVYQTLAPSTIGAGGKMLISSTAGAPRGFFFELSTSPTERTKLIHPETNENPEASRSVLSFLQRRMSALFPAAARRELDNEFAGDGDEFLPRNLIDAAIDDKLGEIASSTRPAFAFLDLSRKRDLTSLVVVIQEKPRRPETADHVIVASIRTWNPKESRTGETDFAEVRAALLALPQRFPNLKKVLVDEGAEAGSVLPWARSQIALVLRVEGFLPGVETNMQLWSSLAARLHGGTLSLPFHERLLAELRSLRQESFAFGSKWRVVDVSRRLHRDVSVALAGAVMAAGEARTCTSAVCNDPECSGVAPQQALFSAESMEWSARHPTPDEVRRRDEAERAVGATVQDDAEDAADGGPSIIDAVQQFAKAGLSAFVQRRAARQAASERRIAVWLREQSEQQAAAEEAAELEAHRRHIEQLVKQGGGAWFPPDGF